MEGEPVRREAVLAIKEKGSSISRHRAASSAARSEVAAATEG